MKLKQICVSLIVAILLVASTVAVILGIENYNYKNKVVFEIDNRGYTQAELDAFAKNVLHYMHQNEEEYVDKYVGGTGYTQQEIDEISDWWANHTIVENEDSY